MSRRLILWCMAGILVLLAWPTLADTRVALSRDAVAMGDTVILTIDTDQPVASPDLTPLRSDFGIGNIDSSRRVGFDGQGVRASQQIRIELRPLRSGMLAMLFSRSSVESAPVIEWRWCQQSANPSDFDLSGRMSTGVSFARTRRSPKGSRCSVG